MREELAHIERIERYLDQSMTEEERMAFEQEMAGNEELGQEVDFYKNLREGISRQAIKLDIKKAQYRFVKKAKTRAKWRKFLLGGGSLLIMLIAVFVIAIPENESENSFIAQLFGNYKVEKGGNKYTPASEFFSVDPYADTTLTTAGGSKIHLPKGSLTYPSGRIPEGPIEVEFAETAQADDMVLSGLASSNAGEALESKSIHFINAQKDGEQLYPSDETPPYIEIPTEEDLDPNVRVYQGKRNKEGEMRWERPILPNNYLTPVAFKFLDYYPEGFKDSVKAKLPYKGHQSADRALVDSLYFSRKPGVLDVRTMGDPRDPSTPVYRETTLVDASGDYGDTACGINPRSIQTLTQDKFERSLFATREFVERLKYIYQTCDQKVLSIYLENSEKQLWELDQMAFEYLAENKKDLDLPAIARGKKLFLSNCNSCHILGRPMTGPNLIGVERRWPNKESLYAWIKNPAGVKKMRHPYADQLLREWEPKSGLMPAQPVNDAEIDDILNYIENAGSENGLLADIFKKFASQKLTNVANAHVYATLMERDFKKDIKAFEKEHEQAEKQKRKELTQQFKASQKTIEAYKKLSEKRVKTRLRAYGYKVTTLGWKNVASIVATTGKKFPTDDEVIVSKSTPDPLVVKVNRASEYDHVHAYFAVKKLNVIGKLHRLTSGSFQMNEHRIINLPRENADSIQLIAVGFIAEEIYLHQQSFPTDASEALEISLKKISEATARSILQKHSGKGKAHNILTDLDFQKQFYADNLSRIRMEQDNAFLVSLNNLAFPCCPVSCPKVDTLIHFPEFDMTNWTELRTEEGIEVVHPDGRREYILKSKDPELFEYYKNKK